MSKAIADAARKFIALRREKIIKRAEHDGCRVWNRRIPLHEQYLRISQQAADALEALEHTVNRETSESQLQNAVDKEPSE